MGCCIGLFGAYSLIPPTTCPCGIYTWLHWRQSRTPGSLLVVSVTTKHKSLHWACNRHWLVVELPDATGRTENTRPGEFFGFVRVYYLATVEQKEPLPSLSWSHLNFSLATSGSRKLSQEYLGLIVPRSCPLTLFGVCQGNHGFIPP